MVALTLWRLIGCNVAPQVDADRENCIKQSDHCYADLV